ncbi:MAG: AMP-binding protein, partial [bacterium]|nr:AMP-binding protein [bacterium]
TREKLVGEIDFDGELVHPGDGPKYQEEMPNLEVKTEANDLACVFYTSNFKGEPTGVMIEHTSLINTLTVLQEKYPFGESDVCLLKTPYQFSVSVSELFSWLLGGGGLFVLESGAEKDPQKVLTAIYEQKITHVHFVPTLFNQLVNILNEEDVSKLSGLKYLFLSGEAVVPETVARFNRLRTNIVVENLYGTPETSVFASSYSLSEWSGTGNIPIGKPLNNTKIYILNFIDGEPVLLPRGIPGELCIAGTGLAMGYLENPELTGEAFIDNPFSKGKDDKKLFLTGELGRWLPGDDAGNIEYLGRIDRKVKIRDTRIERGEIENHLLKFPAIKEAVVVARQDASGVYLCAYFVSDEEVDRSIIREKLSETLPPHMVPSYFMKIAAIPLTPEGKTDRTELLDVKHDPQQIEEMLAEIEAEVLRLNKEDIDLDTNFFNLGGHSHKAAHQVAAKIHEAFHVKVSMAELFKRPTLRQLSEFLTEAIEAKYASIEPAEPREYYPQSSAQKRLFFLHELDKEDTVYNIQMMDIYCKGIERNILDDAFKALIKRHESLRTSFHIIDGEPVQKIHDYETVAADFNVGYYETDEDGKIHTLEAVEQQGRESIEGKDFQEVIKGFVRPFDLTRPALLRVGFINIHKYTKILMLDMHHIIT